MEKFYNIKRKEFNLYQNIIIYTNTDARFFPERIIKRLLKVSAF